MLGWPCGHCTVSNQASTHFEKDLRSVSTLAIKLPWHASCVNLSRIGKPRPALTQSLCTVPKPFPHLHLPLNREGRWGTADDFTTSSLHFSLFSTALWDLANSRPVHSLMLSSHLFLCLPCLLPPFTVPCKMVLAGPDERETCPFPFSLRLFPMVRKSSCGQITCWILARLALGLLIDLSHIICMQSCTQISK